MAELDAELSARLSRLAGAVPVAPIQVDLVRRESVRARQQVRVAWLTPLAVIVAGVVMASAMRIGPFAPGATPEASATDPSSGPISTSTRDGDFTLSIEATHATYIEGEPIEIAAGLRYDGDAESAVMSSGGVGEGPVGFGIEEPIFGTGWRLAPAFDAACTSTTIFRGQPIAVPFAKTVSPLFDAAGSEVPQFLSDPELRLAPGVWHIYAEAVFQPFECRDTDIGPDPIDMRADLEITVLPRPGETPLPSVVTPPEPTTAPTDATDSDRDGDFELVLHAGKSHYRTDEPVDVTASLAYLGAEPSVEIVTDGGPLSFAIFEKVFGAIRVGGLSRLTCKRTTLEHDQPLMEGFQKSGGFSNDHPDAKTFRDWMQDPELRLPEGTWHLSVSAGGPCLDDGPAFSVRAQIEIVVSDDPAATPGLPVPTDWADPPVYGGDDDGLAVLQLRSSHASYAEQTPIELEVKYWFADGPALVASHYPPELLLSITQLDSINPTGRGTSYDGACTDLGRVDGTNRHVVLTGSNIAFIRGDRIPARLEDLFVGGALVLPVGRWEINANVEGRFAPCGQAGDGYALSASVVIEVVPG